MERLMERIAVARKAVTRLGEAIGLPDPNEFERDASIQRFEFSFEAVWKAAQAYLRIVEGLDIASPKGVIRASREVGLFDDGQTMLALKMSDDRNLTAHTYNEPLAMAIHGRIHNYHPLLVMWLDKIGNRVQ